MEVGPKHPDVRLRVEKGLQAKLVRFSIHGDERIEERILQTGLVVEDVFKVLRKGKYVPEDDEWSPAHNRWAYAFRHVLVDGEIVKVCVSFPHEDSLVIVVTVILINC